MKRRIFSREFKLSLLQELESKSASQICKEHEIHPVLLSSWKRDYNRDPAKAFSGRGNAWREEAKIAKYERLIGQLYAENALLKKTAELLQQRRAEERRKWPQ